MSRTARGGSCRGEGGELSGRAVAFNRWLPLFAEAVGSQGGRAAEALTPRRFRDTKVHRLNAAVRLPTRVNRALPMRNVQPVPSRSRRTSTRARAADAASLTDMTSHCEPIECNLLSVRVLR